MMIIFVYYAAGNAHNNASYWHIDPSYAQMLADYQFPPNFVARMVNEDEADIIDVVDWNR